MAKAVNERVELDLVNWGRTLARRWWLIVAIALIAAGLAFALSSLQAERYSATAQLLFRGGNPSERIIEGNPGGNAFEPARNAATNLALASNDAVVRRVKARLRSTESVDELKQHFKLSPAGQADIVNVSAEASSPQRAATLANVYADEVVSLRRAAAAARVQVALNAMDRRIAQAGPDSDLANFLRQRREELVTLQAVQTGDVEVSQQAVPPLDPSSPRPARNALIGGALGLLLGVLIATVLGRMDQRLRTSEDAAEVFRAPILGRVPKVSDGERQDQIFLEAFQFLRTNLRLGSAARGNGDARGLRVITVTSPMPGDGKSTVVARLSEALGVVGLRVLAIDLDLRKPGLAAAFDEPPGGPGVADVLLGEARLDEVIQTTSYESVRYIPAGSVQSSASSTVNAAGVRIRDLVVDASRLADVVLLDTAPVSVGAETSAAAAVTDGALVVVDAENMRRDLLRAASEQLHRAGARVLGLVINRVEATLRRSAYGGYYDVPKGAGPRAPKRPAELPEPAARQPSPH
jgi:capsular exopolysaccharide synthesis family protein